jgi:hypothetical protein
LIPGSDWPYLVERPTYLESVDLHIGMLSLTDVSLVADELSRADFRRLELARREDVATGVYRWVRGPKPELVEVCEAVANYYSTAASQERAMFMWRA